MSMIQILDCTLRDGGYVNQWNFGNEKINKVLQGLVDARVDIVECGYLSEKADIDTVESTLYKNVEQIEKTITLAKKPDNMVAMINFGEFNLKLLPKAKNSLLSGIRYAFHKKDMKIALEESKIIKRLGYQLYLQPMVSLTYTDKEFLELIQCVNQIEPYAFYIVDSFGTMKQKDLQRMLFLSDKNLSKDIVLGFHSHNNLQLAYSNAQVVAALQTNRKRIIDSSVFGMGRGAGNLNTELFVEYLNDNYEGTYEIRPLLQVMDHTLNPIYQEKYWGYSLAHYISAIHCCHPNYATYLTDKNSLLMGDIEKIISNIEEDKQYSYDASYIEKLYFDYMEHRKNGKDDLQQLKEVFAGKKVLVIAPGKSATTEKEVIQKFVKKADVLTISINHVYEYVEKVDYVFVSNRRRFKAINAVFYSKVIATSNISNKNVYAKVNYQRLLNEVPFVEDNAGLMLLKLLILLGIKDIYIAGMDGYSKDDDDNYLNKSLKLITKKENLERMNEGMETVIRNYSEQVEIEFITKSRYICF